jgi:hypothetical protein
MLSFLNLSGKQPLSHFEIGFSYLNVGVPSTLINFSLNEVVRFKTPTYRFAFIYGVR